METPSASEFIVKNIQLNRADCVGCQRFERPIMLSFMREGDPAVYDLFLTAEQGKSLGISRAEAPASVAEPAVVDYGKIAYAARDTLGCGHVDNVPAALATLHTRYHDALARIATLEKLIAG